MRTQPWLLSALVLGLLVGTAAASPPDSAKEILDQVDANNPLNPKSDGSPHPMADGSADPLGANTFLGKVTLALSVVAAPVISVSDGVLNLGLGLVTALFAGVEDGGHTVASAARVVAEDPAGSATIAFITIVLIGLASTLGVLALKYGGIASIPLYSRIAKNQLLDNQVRQQIFQLIEQNPGINVSEIARRLDIAWGTATHHLHKLRQERLVNIRIASNQKCYFPNGGTYTPHEMDVMSALKNPTARSIAEFLLRHGPQRHGEIAQILQLTPALVSFHTAKLVQAGVVARARQGRTTILTPLEPNLSPHPRPVPPH